MHTRLFLSLPFFVIGALAGGVLVGGWGSSTVPEAAASGVPVPQLESDRVIPDVVERVTPAVVSIYSTRELARDPFGGFRGRPAPRGFQQGMGSGVIVRPDGVVLTNNHVVEGASDIRVVLTDRREFKAEIVGRDPRTDVAVLRIGATGLPTLPFGDSSKVRVGQNVLAIGNPLGVGLTVSRGIVSARGRANVGIVDYEEFIQTDAAINPGNSGGALVDLKGELVGMNAAIASRTGGFQGIGFAIPSELVRQVMEILLRDGRVSRGQMGVLIQDVTPQMSRALDGAPVGGIVVSEVIDGTPAARAGLRAGDVIVKLDGKPVKSAAYLRNRIALRGGGGKVTLDVWRDGKMRDVTMKLMRQEE